MCSVALIHTHKGDLYWNKVRHNNASKTKFRTEFATNSIKYIYHTRRCMTGKHVWRIQLVTFTVKTVWRVRNVFKCSFICRCFTFKTTANKSCTSQIIIIIVIKQMINTDLFLDERPIAIGNRYGLRFTLSLYAILGIDCL